MTDPTVTELLRKVDEATERLLRDALFGITKNRARHHRENIGAAARSLARGAQVAMRERAANLLPVDYPLAREVARCIRALQPEEGESDGR